MTFSGCIQVTPSQVMAKLKNKLPSVVQKCQDLRDKYVNGQFGDVNGEEFVTYLAYIDLTDTYQKMIEYYDNDSGPTFEEVD